MYFIMFFVGFMGNLLVVVVIIRWKMRKCMNDFFVLNFSVFDFCLIIFCLLLLIYVELMGFVGFWFYCKFVWLMVIVLYCFSIYIIIFMVCYCCRVLFYFFEFFFCKKIVLLWILIIWFFFFMVVILLIIVLKFWEDFYGSVCYEDWFSISFKWGYIVVFFIL